MHEFTCLDMETTVILLARVNEPVLLDYADGDFVVQLTDYQYTALVERYPVYARPL